MTGVQDASNKGIAGYRLRDVDILSALVVPDDADGVEIQIALRPVNERTIGALGWKHFEVSSVTPDSRWTLHARGMITVDLSDAISSSAKPSKRSPLSGYTRHIDPQDMFASLQARGIHHGPKFQNTARITQDGKEPRSVSSVSIPDTSVAKDLPREHVVHPTTLDAVILSSYGALPGAGEHEHSAKVPQSIQSVWASSGISRETGHSFECDASLSHNSSESFQADVSVVDTHTEVPVLEIHGLVCQSLGRSSSAPGDEANTSENELCSKIEWAPDLSMGRQQTFDQVKSELSRQPDDGEIKLMMRLRRVCVYFCNDALTALTPQDVERLEPHHVKFHGWMQEQVKLAAANVLGPDSNTWLSDSPQERDHHISRATEETVDGKLVCRLGPLLLSMLRGERSPLEVMMEDKLLYSYYEHAVRMGPSLAQLAALLRKLAHKNPRARVLEIGGGTGGATRHMLRALGTADDGGPLATSWHFTDISSGFFEAARTEFAAWSDLLTFDRLDIEQDPASQGFELESYDIVVACQVLHATKSMARTMANVRSVMKPGASLLLMETTQDAVDLQFIFGLLPGWWLSEEPERQASPSLTVPFWDQVLRGAGFTGIDVDIRDCDSDMYSISTIMSRVPGAASSRMPSTEVILVASKTASPPVGFVDSLKSKIKLFTGTRAPDIVTLEGVADNSSVYSDKICVFLGEVAQPILYDLDKTSLDTIKTMAINCSGLLWVTAGGAVDSEYPDMSMSHGFLRALRNEYFGRKYMSLDLDPRPSDQWSQSTVSTILQVLEAGFGRATNPEEAIDLEYAERDGMLLVPRLYKDSVRNKMVAGPADLDWESADVPVVDEPLFQNDRSLRLQVGVPGLLDTLAFEDDDSVDATSSLSPDTVEIEPRAYGLNFRDVMVAMGQLRERVMGLECAGVITNVGSEAEAQGYHVGDHVMALLLGPFASRARISWHGVAHMPQRFSFEEAASLPMIYSTAYVGLVDIARLQPGQSVLVHAAAGGVGQAALMLARHLGAGEIYATVGSQEKRELLMSKFGIPAENIFSSRDGSFAPTILEATGGRGVDVVLNSLAGPLLQASFDVLAPFGHFVEIGKKDLEGNSLLEMGTFSRVASFTAVDMMTLLRRRGLDAHRVVNEIGRLADEGAISPIHPVTTYPMGDVSKAFRLLQTGKHTGKVVLSTAPDQHVKVLPRVSVPTDRLDPDASYLLVGGAGGLGRSIAHWMVDHGAKNLILLSRSAGKLDRSSTFVADLGRAGCRVMPVSCDISTAGHLAKALRTCEEAGLPAVRGVIQGAMVLQDAIMEQMTFEDWQTCVRPKVAGSWNLHAEFEQSGSLDFFVMLSSLSGILGFTSQANYAAGGTYQDALARWRQARNLPGTSIDLGAVKGVGYVAETAGVAERMRKAGETFMLSEQAVLRALNGAVFEPTGHPQVLLGLNSGPGTQWDSQGQSQMSRDARYLPLRYRRSQQSKNGPGSGAGRLDEADTTGQAPLSSRLAQAESRDAAAAVVGEAIAAKLSAIFMIPSSEIDLAQPPALYGVDSLVAVELRNMLVLQAAAEVSIFSILQSVSLAGLASDVVAKSRHIKEIA